MGSPIKGAFSRRCETSRGFVDTSLFQPLCAAGPQPRLHRHNLAQDQPQPRGRAAARGEVPQLSPGRQPAAAGALPRAGGGGGAVQYSTVQYSTVQDRTVQYSTVQYSTAQLNI